MQNVTNDTSHGLDGEHSALPSWLKWFLIGLLVFIGIVPCFFDCRRTHFPTQAELDAEASMEMYSIERVPEWMRVADNEDDDPLPRYSAEGLGDSPLYDNPPAYDDVVGQGTVAAEVVGNEAEHVSLREESV